MNAAPSVPPSAIALDDAMAFIWREAELLDRLDYRPWLTLWGPEGRYVIPTDRGASDFESVLNVAYDDAAMRESRVKRLLSGFSMSSAPPARTVRTVSRFVAGDRTSVAIELRTAMILVEYKYEHTRVLAADVDYRLIATPEGMKLDRKVVRLINADDFLHGIGYLL